MSTIKIDKDDPARILLTEVLPYEVPIIFSNEGLYRFVSSHKRKPKILMDILSRNITIPFNYRIRKSSSSDRKLSLMHPGIQREFIEFYHNYDALIIDLCKRSLFSLRAPSRVASWYRLRDSSNLINDENEGVETDESESQGEQSNASSYFVYTKCDFLYKYFESYEFHELEKKFSRLMTFDISKCFQSIYSHTIAWAVKDKTFAKQNIGRKGFESKFDELMQQSNYKETNGIIIGPEVSRIFAEIILQRIDLNVMNKLETEKQGKLRNERDYTIRRYVDDYFVFTNREEVQEQIYELFKKELEEYRLFVNDKKTDRTVVPFITKITVAKTKLENMVENIFQDLIYAQSPTIEETNNSKNETDSSSSDKQSIFELANIIWPPRKASKLIMELKSIIKTYNVDYDCVSAYFLVKARQHMLRILTNEQFAEVGKNESIKVQMYYGLFLIYCSLFTRWIQELDALIL